MKEEAEVKQDIEQQETKENTKKSNKTKTSAKKTTGKKTKKNPKKEDKITELGNKLDEINDKYIRLSAEFDNYRKRTLKEKMELVKSGGESTLLGILPVFDDFERALQNIETTKDIKVLKEGIQLIYNKFSDFLKSNGVEAIDKINTEFDTDLHEAVTRFPVKEDNKKGKVIDIVEKGYKLHDKVIRFAKVVVGE